MIGVLDRTEQARAAIPGINRRKLAASAARTLLVLVGGYLATAAMVSAVSVFLSVLLGYARSEAVIAASLLGFLIYLAILVWGFAARRLAVIGLMFALLCVIAGAFLYFMRMAAV